MKSDLQNYSQVKERLDVIVDKVTDENISLDEALDLYDEAVSLASRASELIEIVEENDENQEGSEPASDSPQVRSN